MKQGIRLPGNAVVPCLVAAVLGVFFLVLWLAPTSPAGSRAMLPAEFLKQYGMTGSYDQRLAHLSAVLAGLAASAAAFLYTMYRRSPASPSWVAPKIGLWPTLFLVTIALALLRQVAPHGIIHWAMALAATSLVFLVFAPRLSCQSVGRIAMLLAGAYLALIIAPGLLTSPIPILVSDPDSIAQVELHVMALVQSGSAISAGQKIFKELPMGYGLLMPSILSVYESRIGSLGFSGHLRYVQLCQVALAVTAAMAYFSYRPRNHLGVLVVLLLSGPYWASAGLGIWHPNHTGMRGLTFSLGILVLIHVGRLDVRRAALALGAVGMLAVLINPETAVAVICGFLVYLGLRTRRLPFGAILRAIAAGVALFFAYFILYRLALGRPAFGSDPASILATLRAHVTGDIGMRLFTRGSAGENYFIVPFALVMFAHAGYIIIAAFRDLARGALSHRRAVRVAIATILIIWLSYYFNMPNWWQIWSHLFLYGFLLIDLLDPRLLGVGRARAKPVLASVRPIRTKVARLAPLLLLAVMIPQTNSHLFGFMTGFMHPPWTKGTHEASITSGLLVPHSVGDALEAKAKKLLELKASIGSGVRYLTYNVEFVPTMTKVFEPVPTRALWGYVYGDSALDPAIDTIFVEKPAVILIDAPTGPLAVTGERKVFQNRIRESVRRRYRLAETASGWEIYRPIEDH